MMERLNNGKEIIGDIIGGDRTPTEESFNSETMEDGGFLESKKLVPGSYEDVERLCREVWPVLALMGGVDQGLRVGGRCSHKITGKRGILLGSLRIATPTVKVQWEDDPTPGYGDYYYSVFPLLFRF